MLDRVPYVGCPFIVVRRPLPKISEDPRVRPAKDALAKSGQSIRRIIFATAAYFDVEPYLIVYKSRLGLIVDRRAVAMTIARSRTKFSLTEVGRRFGGFDHSVVQRHSHRVSVRHLADVEVVTAILDDRS